MSYELKNSVVGKNDAFFTPLILVAIVAGVVGLIFTSISLSVKEVPVEEPCVSTKPGSFVGEVFIRPGDKPYIWDGNDWLKLTRSTDLCVLTDAQQANRNLGHVYFCNMSTGELYGEQWEDTWYNETKDGWESKDRYWGGSGIPREKKDESEVNVVFDGATNIAVGEVFQLADGTLRWWDGSDWIEFTQPEKEFYGRLVAMNAILHNMVEDMDRLTEKLSREVR